MTQPIDLNKNLQSLFVFLRVSLVSPPPPPDLTI